MNGRTVNPEIAVRNFKAIGTTASVAIAGEGSSAPAAADEAQRILAEELAAIDETCSRFRCDSEIFNVQRASGEKVEVSPLLFEAFRTACDVALMTAGTVDPTVGEAVISLGYDRSFELIEGRNRANADMPASFAPARIPTPAPGWWKIELDDSDHTVLIPPGTCIDLGSSAKSLAADRAARRISHDLERGILVNLGGDISVCGPTPIGGWAVGIAEHCTVTPDRSDQVVAISSGGLATSGTLFRAWSSSGRKVHHIIDPATGDSAATVWTLVSVAAPSCVEANAFSTAAIVWGEDAPGILDNKGIAARLVHLDGHVVYTGSWPLPEKDNEAA